ncbi:hypothetical protein [Natrinema halophilum]|uniref:Uncharacterized protein n=1 Tax=Natrinema halophilum TaxID=1699371 RepID=A0A7D5L3D6_9EURY|nr:hypothetical protein [Natrinema halophilum]QLG49165.1 hypothetical protein HYG82_10010 [Natrinema halophilum]
MIRPRPFVASPKDSIGEGTNSGRAESTVFDAAPIVAVEREYKLVSKVTVSDDIRDYVESMVDASKSLEEAVDGTTDLERETNETMTEHVPQ